LAKLILRCTVSETLKKRYVISPLLILLFVKQSKITVTELLSFVVNNFKSQLAVNKYINKGEYFDI